MFVYKCVLPGLVEFGLDGPLNCICTDAVGYLATGQEIRHQTELSQPFVRLIRLIISYQQTEQISFSIQVLRERSSFIYFNIYLSLSFFNQFPFQCPATLADREGAVMEENQLTNQRTKSTFLTVRCTCYRAEAQWPSEQLGVSRVSPCVSVFPLCILSVHMRGNDKAKSSQLLGRILK